MVKEPRLLRYVRSGKSVRLILDFKFYQCLSFKMSRISVNSTSSFDGAGGAVGAGVSSFFVLNLFMNLMAIKIENAIIKKSIVV